MASKRRKNKVLVAFPITKAMLKVLDEAAEESERSRSAEIRLALRNHLSLTGKPSTKAKHL